VGPRRLVGGAVVPGLWGRGALSISFFIFFPNFFAESHMYLRHTFAVSSSFDSRQRAVCCDLVCRKYFAESNSIANRGLP
jgi:hypothetical protein